MRQVKRWPQRCRFLRPELVATTSFRSVNRTLFCRAGDELLLQQLLFDAVVTAPLEAYWNALMLNDR